MVFDSLISVITQGMPLMKEPVKGITLLNADRIGKLIEV